jgi:hypothetical protein
MKAEFVFVCKLYMLEVSVMVIISILIIDFILEKNLLLQYIFCLTTSKIRIVAIF